MIYKPKVNLSSMKDNNFKDLDLDKKEITKLEDLDLTFINKKGRTKMIKWGKDFENWEIEQQNEYLRALCSAFNEALGIMQDEKFALAQEMEMHKKNTEAADQKILIFKNTQINAINDLNRQLNDLAQEKTRLERRVKELESTQNS